MDESKIPFHRRAFFAFHQLKPDEQAAVRKAIDSVADLPISEWAKVPGVRTTKDPATFLLCAGDSVRLIIDAPSGQPLEVGDIVRQETLDAFAKARANGTS